MNTTKKGYLFAYNLLIMHFCKRSGYENNMHSNMDNKKSKKKDNIYYFYNSRRQVVQFLQAIISVKWFSTFSLFLE